MRKQMLKAALALIAALSVGVGGPALAGLVDEPTGASEIVAPTPSYLYYDGFSDPQSGWDTVSDGWYSRGYRDGEYQIQIGRANMEWPIIEGSPTFSADIDVRLSARLVGSAGGEQAYALLFRAEDDDHLYRFAVSPATREYSLGKFWVDKFGNPAYDALVPWTISSAIGGGGIPDHLRVVCKGPQIGLFVNQVFLQAVSDSSYLSGRVGMDAIAFASSTGVDARFDDLVVFVSPGPVWPSPTPSPRPTRAPTVPTVPVARVAASIRDEHDPIIAGWKQRYTVSLRNEGDGDLNQLSVSDTVPPGCDAILDESSEGASVDDGKVIWILDRLPAGGKLDLELVMRVWSTHKHGSILTNCVEVSAKGLAPIMACEDTVVMHEGPPTPTRRPTATATPPTSIPTLTPTIDTYHLAHLPLILKPANAVPLRIGLAAGNGPRRSRP